MRLFKDPHATLDYLWDWGDWLAAGETITAIQIVLTGGLTLASDRPAPAIIAGTRAGASVPSGAVLAWLAGGTVAPAPALATCRITTSAGRIDDRTFLLMIVER